MDDWCTQSPHTSVVLLWGSFEGCPAPLRGAGVWEAAFWTQRGNSATLKLMSFHQHYIIYNHREGQWMGSTGLLVLWNLPLVFPFSGTYGLKICPWLNVMIKVSKTFSSLPSKNLFKLIKWLFRTTLHLCSFQWCHWALKQRASSKRWSLLSWSWLVWRFAGFLLGLHWRMDPLLVKESASY